MKTTARHSSEKNLLVLDWNGTLLDDTAVCATGFNALMKAMGHHPVSLLDYQKFYDMPITRFFSNAGIPENRLQEMLDTIPNAYLPVYFSLSDKAPLRDGALDLVEQARAHDFHVIILSNHFSDDIKKKATRLGVWPFIHEILAFNSGEQFKKVTKGEKLKAYIDQHGFQQDRSVIIGDTQEEIRIALEANIPCISLSGGNTHVDHLISEDRKAARKPHFLVPELTMVPALLHELRLMPAPAKSKSAHRSLLLTPCFGG